MDVLSGGEKGTEEKCNSEDEEEHQAAAKYQGQEGSRRDLAVGTGLKF
jgi:hypothetical protein